MWKTPRVLKLAEGLIAGNRTALSRAITLIESTREQDKEQSEALLDYVLTLRQRQEEEDAAKAGGESNSMNTFRLGIAGPPGAGKSTFVEAMGEYLTGLGP